MYSFPWLRKPHVAYYASLPPRTCSSLTAILLLAMATSLAVAQRPPHRFVVEQVADIVPGPQGSVPVGLFAHGDMLYFNTWGGNTGLYRTDGSSVQRISDIDAPATIVAGNTTYFANSGGLYVDRNGSLAQLGDFGTTFGPEFAEFQNQLYFTAADKLYRSDGEDAEPVAAASDLHSVRFPTPFGDRLAFSAVGPYGREAYVTDGTTVELLSDISPGVADSSPGEFTAFGDDLYFSANGPGGFELYRYAGGSVDRVADIHSGAASSSPNHLTPLGGALIFNAEGPLGRELYRTDGVTTSLLADIRTGPGDSDPQDVFNHQFTKFGNELLFVARPTGGYGPYRTDGEIVSPLTMPDGTPMRGLSTYFTVAGDRVLFLANQRLNLYDGQTARPLSDLHVRSIALFQGEVILNAAGPDGIELYTLRGDEVVQLADIYPGEGHLGDGVSGPFSSNPGNFVEFNGALYFSASGPDGAELYRLSVVPEPPTLALIVVAGVAVKVARRRGPFSGGTAGRIFRECGGTF
jgi:ELWxxDGT repeat protein